VRNAPPLRADTLAAMARGATTRAELPAPLPPETRTVGQVVAEAIRVYGRSFWRALALGVLPAAAGVGGAALPRLGQLVVAVTIGALVVTASYAGATLLVADARADTARVVRAVGAGWLAFLPVPFLASLLILPAVAWLALVGLVVPVVLLERRSVRESFGRAVALARADYVHAVGTLAALVITALLSSSVLFFLLRGQGGAALHVAAFLSVLVISPVVFLGAAILYVDQDARLSARGTGGTMAADGRLPRRKPDAAAAVRHDATR
jgi:hypothetical protein